MSQILLKGYWAAEGYAKVDLEEPYEIFPCVIRPDSQDLAHGHCHRVDSGTISAIYTANDRLYLQINDRRWDIERDRIIVRTRENFLRVSRRTASVYAGWKCVFRSRYCYFGEGGLTTVMPLDAIDAETDDWWLWISRAFPNRKSWMKYKEFLSQGIKQPS